MRPSEPTVDMTPSRGKAATGMSAVTATGSTSVTQNTAMMISTNAHLNVKVR